MLQNQGEAEFCITIISIVKVNWSHNISFYSSLPVFPKCKWTAKFKKKIPSNSEKKEAITITNDVLKHSKGVE